MIELHKPVLLEKSLQQLNIKKDGIYIDGTFGTGGHARAILEKLQNGKLIAFEWDEKQAALKQDFFNSRSNFLLINDSFSNLKSCLRDLSICTIDGLLLDLGLSSYQINDPDKGLSFRFDAPLDMRINSKSKLTAKEVINNYPVNKLSDIFYHYGEERNSRSVARKIIKIRQKKTFNTTQELVSVIASCFVRKSKKHPARKIFQALRIYINKELENLTTVLEQALELLSIGGRIAVISYHSLEDRIVKNTFREHSSSNKFHIVTKKPLTPETNEIKGNHRARSAKLRVIERIS